MNRTKTILAALTAAALLSSCDGISVPPTDSTAPVISEQTASQTTAQAMTSQTPSDTAAQPSETTEASAAEQTASMQEYLHKIDVNTDDGHIYTITPVSGNVVCGVKEYFYDAGGHSELYFIDVTTGEVTLVPLPEGIDAHRIHKGSGDLLCIAASGEYEYADDADMTVTGFHAGMAKVTADYDFETIKDCTMSDISFEYNGHRICEWEESIYEITDGKEKKIVEGRPYEYISSKAGQRITFACGIDDNRFAYLVTGYERLPGFGFYDFSTDTSTFLPDTEDMYPIGAYNGKIYSYKSPYASSICSEIYVTDTDTKTTTLLKNFCPDNPDLYAEFAMSDDGSMIAAAVSDYEGTSELVIADSLDGHTIKSYDLTGAGKYPRPLFVNNTTLFISTDDGYYTLKLD